MTHKQKLFCENYIRHWNASRAAREAGYKGTPGSLGVIGHENLKKVNIKAYIDKRIEEETMSTNEVLHRLTEWGRGSHQPFMEIDDEGMPNLHLGSNEAQDKIHLIKKIKQNDSIQKDGKDSEKYLLNRTFEIELHDAKDAVIQLAKMKGMFVDLVDLRSSDGSMSPKTLSELYDEERGKGSNSK